MTFTHNYPYALKRPGGSSRINVYNDYNATHAFIALVVMGSSVGWGAVGINWHSTTFTSGYRMNGDISLIANGPTPFACDLYIGSNDSVPISGTVPPKIDPISQDVYLRQIQSNGTHWVVELTRPLAKTDENDQEIVPGRMDNWIFAYDPVNLLNGNCTMVPADQHYEYTFSAWNFSIPDPSAQIVTTAPNGNGANSSLKMISYIFIGLLVLLLSFI